MSARGRVRLVALGVLGLAAAMLGAPRLVGRPDAQSLFAAAAETSLHVPLEGEAKVGCIVLGQWVERRAHVLQSGGQRALSFLGGGPELFDNGEFLWLLNEGSPRRVGPSAGARPSALFFENYQVLDLGAGRMAGQRVRELLVTSRHFGHPAIRLWVEPRSKAAVGRETYSADGELLSRTHFESVRVGAPVEAAEPDLPSPGPGGPGHPFQQPEATTVEEFERDHGFRPVRPAYTPPGYVEDSVYVRPFRGRRVCAELRYQDGFRAMSIYETRSPGRFGRLGRGRGRGGGMGRGGRGMGGNGGGGLGPLRHELVDQTLGRAVLSRRDDMDIVASGDLPEGELERVIESIP